MEQVPDNETVPLMDDQELLKNCVETFIQKLQSFQNPEADTLLDRDNNTDDAGDEADGNFDMGETSNVMSESPGATALKQSDWLCHLCWEER